jgi:hypothetical protein
MITAIKNGIKRNFSDSQWNKLPSDKYGWSLYSEQQKVLSIRPEEIIEKKIIRGEGVTAKKDNDIPEELKINVGPKKKTGPKPKTQE